MSTNEARRGSPEMTTPEDEGAALRRDAELTALAGALRTTAPALAIDPAFRASLRAALLESSSTLRYAALETPVGRIWLAYRVEEGGRALLKLTSARDEAAFVASVRHLQHENPSRDPAPPAQIASLALATIGGERRSGATSSIDLSGLTPFHRKVLEKTREIPRGEVRSYAWVARQIGHPAAVRAVGTALAQNPVPFVIPCHRVIRSDGDLGNYSGGGVETKERILRYEGVDVPELRELARKGLRYRASRNTRIFCLPTCYSRKHAKEASTVYFHSEVEAFAAGYRPCKLCRPAVAG